jgi:hypothetical protein
MAVREAYYPSVEIGDGAPVDTDLLVWFKDMYLFVERNAGADDEAVAEQAWQMAKAATLLRLQVFVQHVGDPGSAVRGYTKDDADADRAHMLTSIRNNALMRIPGPPTARDLLAHKWAQVLAPNKPCTRNMGRQTWDMVEQYFSYDTSSQERISIAHMLAMLPCFAVASSAENNLVSAPTAGTLGLFLSFWKNLKQLTSRTGPFFGDIDKLFRNHWMMMTSEDLLLSAIAAQFLLLTTMYAELMLDFDADIGRDRYELVFDKNTVMAFEHALAVVNAYSVNASRVSLLSHAFKKNHLAALELITAGGDTVRTRGILTGTRNLIDSFMMASYQISLQTLLVCGLDPDEIDDSEFVRTSPAAERGQARSHASMIATNRSLFIQSTVDSGLSISPSTTQDLESDEKLDDSPSASDVERRRREAIPFPVSPVYVPTDSPPSAKEPTPPPAKEPTPQPAKEPTPPPAKEPTPPPAKAPLPTRPKFVPLGAQGKEIDFDTKKRTVKITVAHK